MNRLKIFDSITLAAKAGAQSNDQPSTSGTNTTQPISTDQSEESTQIEVDCDNFSDNFDFDDDTLTAIEQSFVSEKPKFLLPLFTTANKEINITTNPQTARPSHISRKPPISVFSRGKENEPPLKKHKVQETSIAKKNQESVSTSTNIVTNKQKSESTSTNNKTNKLASKSTSTNIETNKQASESTPINIETKKLALKTTSTNIKTNELVLGSTSIISIKSKNLNVKYENCVFHGNIINNFYCSNSKTTEKNE